MKTSDQPGDSGMAEDPLTCSSRTARHDKDKEIGGKSLCSEIHPAYALARDLRQAL